MSDIEQNGFWRDTMVVIEQDLKDCQYSLCRPTMLRFLGLLPASAVCLDGVALLYMQYTYLLCCKITWRSVKLSSDV